MKGVAEKRPQTAIQGVMSATLYNTLSKIAIFSRHVVITAVIGLSVGLDAFYIAVAVVSVFINTFGDIFDSVGIPFLLRVRGGGGEVYRRLEGTLFSWTVKMGVGLTALMVLSLPLVTSLVPGFPAGSRGLIWINLFALVPYALVYLPYHCLGSFQRARRDFRSFFMAEFLVALIALGMILAMPRTEIAVPISVSVGYCGGALVLWFMERRHIRFVGSPPHEETREIRGMIWKLLPVYALVYALLLIDRYFASFLQTGGIAALSYAFMLATAIPLILNVENVFITPLSEESDHGALMTQILCGALIVTAPVVAFTMSHARDIVALLFERGAFTATAAELTSTALSHYIFGLPAMIIWPVCYRLYQVYRRPKTIYWIGLMAVLFNGTMNYLLVMRAGWGIAGIAFTTAVSNWLVLVTGLLWLPRLGVHVAYRDLRAVVANVAAGTFAAFAVSASIPGGLPHWVEVPFLGTVFIVVYALVVFLLPGRQVRVIRDIVLHSVATRRGN